MLFTLQSYTSIFPFHYTFLNKFEVMSLVLEVKQQIYILGTIGRTYAIHFVKLISVYILKYICSYVESLKVM